MFVLLPVKVSMAPRFANLELDLVQAGRPVVQVSTPRIGQYQIRTNMENESGGEGEKEREAGGDASSGH